MKSHWLIVVLLSIALAGCATQAGYKRLLQTWIGQTEETLVASWGALNNVYTLPNGSKVLTYNHIGPTVAVVNPSTPYSPAYGYSIPTGCTTSFTVSKGGVITYWRFQGNRCRANFPEESVDNTGAIASEEEVELDLDGSHHEILEKNDILIGIWETGKGCDSLVVKFDGDGTFQSFQIISGQMIADTRLQNGTYRFSGKRVILKSEYAEKPVIQENVYIKINRNFLVRVNLRNNVNQIEVKPLPKRKYKRCLNVTP